MTMTIDLLKTYLHDLGVDFEPPCAGQDPDEVLYYFRTLKSKLRVFASVGAKGNMLQFYIYPPIHGGKTLQPETWELLQESINYLNHNYSYGRWSYDDEGDVRVTFCYLLNGQEATRRQIAQLHFILADLVVYQAQVLQIIQQTGINIDCSTFGVSAAAVLAASQHPEQLSHILKAINAGENLSQLLHEVAQVPYAPQEEDAGSVLAESMPDIRALN